MRSFLAALALAFICLCACASAHLYYTERMGQPWFDGGQGIWTQPLASNAPIDPESSSLVGVLGQWFPGQTGNRANFSTSNGVYVYIATSSTPLVKITVDTNKPALQAVMNGVPFPAGAQPSPGHDERMAIYQPQADCWWDFWHLYWNTADLSWHTSAGGRDCNVRSDPGVYKNVKDTAGNVLEGNLWGGPATGFPGGSGAVMIDELAHGTIPHAVSIAVATQANCARLWSYPAERTDGSTTAILDANGEPTNCIPEGARFRLPPPCPTGTPSTPGVCFNLSDLAGDPPIVTELAQAAQTYGLIDENSTAGGVVGVESSDTQSPFYQDLQADPYTTAVAGVTNTPFFGSYLNQNALALFPWSWLELVQMHVTSKADPAWYLEADPPSPFWPTP